MVNPPFVEFAVAMREENVPFQQVIFQSPRFRDLGVGNGAPSVSSGIPFAEATAGKSEVFIGGTQGHPGITERQ
jgi:hypothetical protein